MIFDAVHNYYEQMVCDEIHKTLSKDNIAENPDFLEDVACIALNLLPPRYIRHRIDLGFYMTSHERERMEFSVRDAVSQAVEYVMQRLRQDDDHYHRGANNSAD